MVDHSFLYHVVARLQNSRIFCERKRHSKIIFKRKVWSECRNGEEEWGETPHTYGRVRLARFTREDHAYGASRLPKMEENDCFAVYVVARAASLRNMLFYQDNSRA